MTNVTTIMSNHFIIKFKHDVKTGECFLVIDRESMYGSYDKCYLIENIKTLKSFDKIADSVEKFVSKLLDKSEIELVRTLVKQVYNSLYENVYIKNYDDLTDSYKQTENVFERHLEFIKKVIKIEVFAQRWKVSEKPLFIIMSKDTGKNNNGADFFTKNLIKSNTELTKNVGHMHYKESEGLEFYYEGERLSLIKLVYLFAILKSNAYRISNVGYCAIMKLFNEHEDMLDQYIFEEEINRREVNEKYYELQSFYKGEYEL